MKVCFPVVQNQGLGSLICEQFDSAPLCVIVDTATRTLIEVANRAPQDPYSVCRELIRRSGTTDAAFVVDGIGGAALTELKRAGFRVFQALPGTVDDNLKSIARNSLPELPLPRETMKTDGSGEEDDDDGLPQFGCGF